MPTVNDAARITTRDSAVWRTCGGCGLLAALPADVDTCPGCARATKNALSALDGSEIIRQYAMAMGRIQAWADMPYTGDAERLDSIRQILADLDRFHASYRKGADGCR